MMRKVLLAVLLVGVLANAQQRPKVGTGRLGQTGPAAGRYQLVQSKVLSQSTGGNQAAFDAVFLLDTQTGNVWRFEDVEVVDEGNQKKFLPAHFSTVFVDDLNGSYIDYMGRFNTKK